MRKIHRARKALAKITQGEKNTLHVYKCKIRINLYRTLEFRIIFFFNYEGWFKSNFTDIIVFVARKKNSKKILLHLYIGMFITFFTRCSLNQSFTRGQFFTKDRSIASNKQSTTHETVSVYITSLANVTYRRYNVHWWSFKY